MKPFIEPTPSATSGHVARLEQISSSKKCAENKHIPPQNATDKMPPHLTHHTNGTSRRH